MRADYYFILDTQVVGHYAANSDTPGDDAQKVRDRYYPGCAVVVLLGTESKNPIGHVHSH